MSKNYDLIVIGGGSGGHAAARKAASSLSRVALVEAADTLGGLCILRGCMPSKTLIESANLMRSIREAGSYGVDLNEAPQLNWSALQQRLDTLIGGFQSYREEAMKNSNYELIRGTARFTGKDEIEVCSPGAQNVRLQASAYIISTGSEVFVPDIEGLPETPYWTSDEVTQLTEIPATLAIIGAGAIGMECAHLYEGFGTAVTVLARSRVLSEFEEDLASALKKESEERGIVIVEGAQTQRVSYDQKTKRFTLTYQKSGGKTQQIEVEALLVATGRVARLSSLNLEAPEVDYDKKGITIDQYCQTSNPTIYAVGDCAASLPLVHLAVYQGERVGAELRSPREEKTDLSSLSSTAAFYGVFTEPEVVKVGLSHQEAEQRGHSVREASYRFSEQGKGEIKQAKHGFAKLLFEKGSHRILGASAIGPNVIDLAHVMQIAISQNLTANDLLDVPFYHPTLAEIWSYVAEEYLDSLDE